MQLKYRIKKIHRMLKNKKELLKQRLRYMSERQDQIYCCEIKYYGEQLVEFGVIQVPESYEKEYEIATDIWVRELQDGSQTYMTYERGEYHGAIFKIKTPKERILVLYRPYKWDFMSRDKMLTSLFEEVEYKIEVHSTIVEEAYQEGKVSLEEMNERIRKSNLAKWEIEQLRDKYCHTGI